MPKIVETADSLEQDTKTTVVDTVHLVSVDTVFIPEGDSTKSTTPTLDEGAEGLQKIQKVISIGKIFWSIVFLIFSYFVIRLLVFIVEGFAERNTNYRFTLKSISPFIKTPPPSLALYIVVEGIIQPPRATLLAFFASFGIAIGFASQDILKNIFGGIMILFDRPFQVGDKIQVGEHYGEVKEIGLRSTRIITKDDSMISVPNAEVVNTAVSNSNSGEANCQVVAEIYLPISVDTNKARQLAMEAARVSRYVFLNKPIQVMFVNEVKERRSFLKMRLKAYVSDIRYEFAFQSDMTEIVMDEMLKQGLIKVEDLT
jgi:small-conductance mechanosensitive channel